MNLIEPYALTFIDQSTAPQVIKLLILVLDVSRISYTVSVFLCAHQRDILLSIIHLKMLCKFKNGCNAVIHL